MSEGPSTNAPETSASGDEPVPAPEEPRRRSRRALLILSCATVLSAAVIAAALIWALAYPPPGPKYSHLPKPCTLLSVAILDAYLPSATAATRTLPASGDQSQSGLCQWSSVSGGETRTLDASVIVFGSPSAITLAQQDYTSIVSSLRCHCRGVMVGTRMVTGLGDQATALFITAEPDANISTAPNAYAAGANLIVRSSNAVIDLNYGASAAATGTLLAPGTDAAQLTILTSMARGILAALARPTAAPPGSIAPLSPEPHYAGRRDPCRLITSATLAKYAPGGIVSPLSSSAGSPSALSEMSACAWGSIRAQNIVLALNVFPDTSNAFQRFTTDRQGSVQSGSGTTVSGTEELRGLGDDAMASFQIQNGAHLVELTVWSGNAEIQYSYWGPGGRTTDRATLLAGGVAIARDALTALANPATSAYPTGPVYASPHDPCTLIRPATVATYQPASTASPSTTDTPLSQLNNCAWTGVNGSLSLFVTIYPDPDSALGGFESDLQYSRQNQIGPTINGVQPVKDLGQQATALLETSFGSPEVALYVLSGNAEIDVDFSDTPFNGPQPSRASVLAADIVMAREVLAGLPH